MEKWEYRHHYIAIFGDNLDGFLPTGKQMWQIVLEEELQRFGDIGWELVSIDHRLLDGTCRDGYALFKRRKEERHHE